MHNPDVPDDIQEMSKRDAASKEHATRSKDWTIGGNSWLSFTVRTADPRFKPGVEQLGGGMKGPGRGPV